MHTKYDTDFYTWTQEQAGLLRQGRFQELDAANLIEELEDMGRSEKRELANRLIVLLMHLLKWQYEPTHRCKSWRTTIRLQRLEITKCLRDNPGLKPMRLSIIADIYNSAVLQAAGETDLDEATFPVTCPWNFEQVMTEDFWPEA